MRVLTSLLVATVILSPAFLSARGDEKKPVYRVLAADKGKVAIVNARGEVEWEYANKAEAHDLHMLPSGNILLPLSATQIAEVTPDKKTVWEYTARPKEGYTGR